MRQKSIKLNALLNVIKQCTSIVFPLITYPYVSHILGAENLGRYSFSDSIVQIIITFAMIGIPTYAVREGSMIRNEDVRLSNFCSEIFTINCISVLFSYLLLLTMVLFVKKVRVESAFILIFSLNIISKCMGRDWLNSIYEEYLYISLRFIAIHVISLVFIFLFVKDENDLIKYVVIMAFSEFFGNALNIYYTNKRVPYRLTFSRNLQKHIKPILILFCSSIATTIYIRSDITILGFLKSDSDVGVYTMSSKIYMVVKNILNAVITVSIPRLSFYLGKSEFERYNSLLNNIRNALILLLLPAAAGLFCLSGDVMYIIGGAEFQRGELSLKVLCVAMMFAVFGCFFAHAILIVNRQEKVFFKATVISALLNIVLNLILIPAMGINGAALTTALSELCIVLICELPARNYFKNDKEKLIKYLIPTTIECIWIFGITRVMIRSCNIRKLRILGIITLSLGFYLIVLAVLKNELFLDVVAKIRATMRIPMKEKNRNNETHQS